MTDRHEEATTVTQATMKNVGKHFRFPPQPMVEEDTTFVDAGCVRVGVEYRAVTNDDLLELFKGTPFEAVRGEGTPGLDLAGVSVHVCDAATGTEYVRFDVFDDDSHYHYLHPWTDPEEVDNHVVYWDDVAGGPMLPWVLESLRTRLPRMLTFAGGGHLVADLDETSLDRAATEVGRLAAALAAAPPSNPT
jgi:hypothetical protein